MGSARKLQSEQPTYDFANSHGGLLRQKRAGRKRRPLSCNEAIHVVFKVNRGKLRSQTLRSPKSFSLIHEIVRRYSKRFLVKVERMSIQGDHIHALIRTHRRSLFHHFFRVVAGQIAQRFGIEGLFRPTSKEHPLALWKYRPFSRIVKGWRAYEIARAYVALNEMEAQGKIPYRKERLRGLNKKEWQLINRVLSKSLTDQRKQSG